MLRPEVVLGVKYALLPSYSSAPAFAVVRSGPEVKFTGVEDMVPAGMVTVPVNVGEAVPPEEPVEPCNP